MSPTKIRHLVGASAFQELPEHLERLCNTSEFWTELERTEESELTPAQAELLEALGCSVAA
ncbi:MAG: hypothetical protein P1V81_17890 [Planctomycetota bacterium]|nr:hypothetical protein [Planctomycetota bacterium]